MDPVKTSFRRRLGAAFLCAWSLFSPSGLVLAGPVAAQGSSAPVVVINNGVPLVNITAPNVSGISYNRYDRFDVDPVGVVLNNSRISGASSLGTQIGANPNFTDRSASVILNEVVTALPSHLNGPLVIFGDSAALIIANPNGVTCNGCGFLNTAHVTLTTGTPQFLNGDAPSAFDTATALALQIRDGQIHITGAGLAAPIDRLDLIAQTLQVDAGIGVTGALNLLAGRQTVDHRTLAVLGVDATNTRTDIGADFAIDASLLGAMTAGSIHLRSTADGMGVRTDARLAATADDLIIHANGEITLRDVSAARDLQINAAGKTTNLGQIAAARDLTLEAAQLDNRNALTVAGRHADITVPGLDNTGGVLQALDTLQLTLPGSGIDLSAASTGTLQAGQALQVTARDIDLTDAFVHAANLTLNTDNRLQIDGQLIAGNDLFLNSADQLIVNGMILALGQINAHAQKTTLGSAGYIETADDLTLTGAILNNAGLLYTHTDLTLSASDFTNSGQILAERDAHLTLGTQANNTGGIIAANQDIDLTLAASQDLGGVVGANRDMALRFDTYTHNPHKTEYLANRDLSITANTLTNADLFEAPRDLTLNVTTLTNQGGQLLAGQDIAITANKVINTGGIIEAWRDITITAADIDNQRGPLGEIHTNWGDYEPPGSVNCKSDHGYCESWQQVETTPAAVISAGRDLKLNATGSITNLGSLLTAYNSIDINADTFNNESRTLTTLWHGHWGEWHGHLWGYSWNNDYGTSVSGYSPAIVESAGDIAIHARVQKDNGNITGNAIWLGGDTVTHGLTDYRYQTPPSTLPPSVIDLSAGKMPANVRFDANAPTLFTSATRLAMLVPLGGDLLNIALPPELRNTQTPFLMDGWLEQQALRQAAIGEAGKAAFFLTGDIDNDRLMLLSNAAEYANREGLKLGTALTDEQIAALTAPMLWYVEETVTGPDGKPYTALVPKLYLPDSSRVELANHAGGVMRANNITLEADTVRNTGFILANDTLTVRANTLINEKRSADIANGGNALRQYVQDAGYWLITGDTVQPGGFMSAATLNLDTQRIESISGEFYQNGQEISQRLAQTLGNNFVFQKNEDHIHQKFINTQSDNGFLQVVVIVVAVVVSVYTAGAASGLIASAAESSALAAGASATAASAAGASAAGSALGMAASAAAGAMAGNATGQLLLTGKLDAGEMLKAGAVAGITAGILNAPILENGQSINEYAGIKDLAGTGGRLANFDVSNLGQNLAGIAMRGVVNAGVSTAINGGSFQTAFTNSVVSDFAAVGANAIGQSTNPLTVENVASHAALGAVAARLQGKDALAGAIGGAGAAIINPLIDPLVSYDNETNRTTQHLATSMLVTGTLAELAGRDGTVAASAAQNETLNNYLTDKQKIARNAEKTACKGETSCLFKADLKYGLISTKQGTGLLVGIGAGMGYQGVEQLNAIVEMIEHPQETLATLNAIINDPAFREQVGTQIANDYEARINMLTRAYEDGGWDGSITAGVEAGRLAVDVVTAAAAIKGVSQVVVIASKAGGAALADAVAQIAKPVENAAAKAAKGGIGAGEAASTAGRGLVYENPTTLVQSRVDDLLSQIPANSQGRITMGVAVVEDAQGARSVLISTSEPRGYLRPGVTLQPGETVVVGTGHAEADIVSYANANGLKVIDIGATRPICPSCQNVIGPTGANTATPLKVPPKGSP
jgi:filamentous hemagglutinin